MYNSPAMSKPTTVACHCHSPPPTTIGKMAFFIVFLENCNSILLLSLFAYSLLIHGITTLHFLILLTISLSSTGCRDSSIITRRPLLTSCFLIQRGSQDWLFNAFCSVILFSSLWGPTSPLSSATWLFNLLYDMNTSYSSDPSSFSVTSVCPASSVVSTCIGPLWAFNISKMFGDTRRSFLISPLNS